MLQIENITPSLWLTLTKSYYFSLEITSACIRVSSYNKETKKKTTLSFKEKQFYINKNTTPSSDKNVESQFRIYIKNILMKNPSIYTISKNTQTLKNHSLAHKKNQKDHIQALTCLQHKNWMTIKTYFNKQDFAEIIYNHIKKQLDSTITSTQINLVDIKNKYKTIHHTNNNIARIVSGQINTTSSKTIQEEPDIDYETIQTLCSEFVDTIGESQNAVSITSKNPDIEYTYEAIVTKKSLTIYKQENFSNMTLKIDLSKQELITNNNKDPKTKTLLITYINQIFDDLENNKTAIEALSIEE